MQNTLTITHLSKEEKLQIMDMIWDDLSYYEEQLDSPEWHKNALKETEDRFNCGKEQIIELSTAKKILQVQCK